LVVVIIGWLVYSMWKAIHKIKPPPDPDESWTQIEGDYPPGSVYDGDLVEGYSPWGGAVMPELLPTPPGFIDYNIYINASDSFSGPWTNLISIPFSQLDTVLGGDGVALEQWPAGQMPAQHFYSITADGYVPPGTMALLRQGLVSHINQQLKQRTNQVAAPALSLKKQ
jgi:hypothetical protein